MPKAAKYWAVVVLANYGFTFLVPLILRPFWFIKNADLTNLATFEILFTMGILPILLVRFNFWQLKKFKIHKNWFIVNAAIIISCIPISSYLAFYNWADSIGSRSQPDGETLMVRNLEIDSGILISCIGIIYEFFKLYSKKVKKQTVDD